MTLRERTTTSAMSVFTGWEATMPYYRSVGEVPPSGTPSSAPGRRPLRRGADGPGGLLLRLVPALSPARADRDRRRPRSRAAGSTQTPNLPLKPRHLRTHKLDAGPADAGARPAPLLANNDVRIGYVIADRPSPLYRDAVGDECLYVEDGTATSRRRSASCGSAPATT
jgi:homogentisate 1,2-dioxygenase